VSEHALTSHTGRTFHHADFDVADLVARRRSAGTTVSVVIPARDEEATVGTVAGLVHERLRVEAGLVDEVLVVDGDSSDPTASESPAAGAEVVRQSDVLPDAGTARGKGEALWKGLAASTGDLVVFVDADIVDVDERFVVGLLGPLLTDPSVAFTKACYDRPLALGGEVRPHGGGRVTELLARPLLSALWPELAWLAQPLSGEYAGRRALLESLPFVQGYGVELGMLVDIAAGAGVDVIAQVDLDRREHVHQPLDALGRMAAEILQVALDRLAAQGRAAFTEDFGSLLLQPARDETGRLTAVASQVAPAERPPLTEWRAAHG
jgi:glucosyl-3-phosphoglycerate synthase